jgi:hypothetical protein
MKMLDQQEFKSKKREKLLDFDTYKTNFTEAIYAFDIVRQSLEQPASILESLDPYDVMVATKQRAWEGINHLANCYSGGHDIVDLASIYPSVIEYFEVFAHFSKRFKESNASNPSAVAHLALQGSDYSIINRLLSLGICLGWERLIPRLVPLIDYNNPVRDGLVERLLQFYIPGRGTFPADCTRHLPYFKTIKIFSSKDDRAALLAEYLSEWYNASRREPYFESHKKGLSFYGYWAWEAAAIAVVLRIDDTPLKETQFYPGDLVAYARKISIENNDRKNESSELRAKAGDVCPKSGLWNTLDIPIKSESYLAGDVMKGSRSPYGLTVWIYARHD